MSSFSDKVREVVKNIPVGEVRTYGQVAALAGFPGAARAVGSLLRDNYDPNIPCHRVVRADRDVGEYNRGRKNKIKILKEEGVSISGQRV